MESQGEPAAQNRKRAHDGPVSSDESAEGRQDDDGGPLQRGNTKPHTFKACNECRQQKVSGLSNSFGPILVMRSVYVVW